MSDLIHALLTNTLFTGGFLLMVSAAAMALCRRAPIDLYRWVKRQTVIEADVLNDDQAYQWLKVWLNAHPYSKRARLLSVSTVGGSGDCPVFAGERRSLPSIMFTPAPGSHLLVYKRRLVWLSRERKEVNPSGNSFSFWRESMTIRVLGRNQGIIRDLIHDAMLAALPPEDSRIAITVSVYGYWRQVGMKEPREAGSVILEAGVFERLAEALRAFLNSRDYYASLGIPWRFGCLLEGIPGSGKTSTILALAGLLKLNIYILNLAGKGMNDQRLNELLVDVPDKSVVLLEDVDAVFTGREHAEESGVTFSGLLNALDGAASKEGRILFLTTNHVETLDPALIRPGRVDLQLHFGHATEDQAARLFLRFFPDAMTSECQEFARRVGNRVSSMAEVQQYLLSHRGSIGEALAGYLPELRMVHRA